MGLGCATCMQPHYMHATHLENFCSCRRWTHVPATGSWWWLARASIFHVSRIVPCNDFTWSVVRTRRRGSGAGRYALMHPDHAHCYMQSIASEQSYSNAHLPVITNGFPSIWSRHWIDTNDVSPHTFLNYPHLNFFWVLEFGNVIHRCFWKKQML